MSPKNNGFAHLILLFVLVVVGVVGYFVYQNNLFNQNGEKISQPTPTPESMVEDEKMNQPEPKKQTPNGPTTGLITTHARYDAGGDQLLTLNINVPSSWNIKVEDVKPGDSLYISCQKATLTHTSGSILSVEPVCSSYVSKATTWAKDTEIIKKYGVGFSDDFSEKYLLRNSLSPTKYTYHELLKNPETDFADSNPVDIYTATNKTYKPHSGMFLRIDLEVSGNADDILSEADKIVSDLYLTE